MNYEETPEQAVAHREVKSAIQHLKDVAEHHSCAIVGFVFGIDPPIIFKFSNVSQKGPDFTELLLKLEDMSNDKIDKGDVTLDPLE